LVALKSHSAYLKADLILLEAVAADLEAHLPYLEPVSTIPEVGLADLKPGSGRAKPDFGSLEPARKKGSAHQRLRLADLRRSEVHLARGEVSFVISSRPSRDLLTPHFNLRRVLAAREPVHACANALGVILRADHVTPLRHIVHRQSITPRAPPSPSNR
jgi:hypothetical protein